MKLPKLAISIALCLLAGFIGSAFTTPSIATWYVSLAKPVFNPPNWIFGPVWTALYIMMGVSLYLVWSKGLKTKDSKTAVSVFAVQIALNSLWSILFFGLHSPMYAFACIIALWMAIYINILLFMRISKPAGYLLVPYILWVSFAAVLNYYIFILN
jgi:benzodiazapine receptor